MIFSTPSACYGLNIIDTEAILRLMRCPNMSMCVLSAIDLCFLLCAATATAKIWMRVLIGYAERTCMSLAAVGQKINGEEEA
jgi:hypothetical protein